MIRPPANTLPRLTIRQRSFSAVQPGALGRDQRAWRTRLRQSRHLSENASPLTPITTLSHQPSSSPEVARTTLPMPISSQSSGLFGGGGTALPDAVPNPPGTAVAPVPALAARSAHRLAERRERTRRVC